MSVEPEVKRQVREFYDSVGWRQIGLGLYQNARYEDLRPVSREYIHRCHMRVKRHLPERGGLMLDAGSGPIQYPEYVEYSSGFARRVCLDISSLALREARDRIGHHGLYIQGDVAHLPFKQGAFDGLVSLHTIHHLPPDEHQIAFRELYRVLAPGGKAAVVYTWGHRSRLMRLFAPLMQIARGLRNLLASSFGTPQTDFGADEDAQALLRTPGTFTTHHDSRWLRERLGGLRNLRILVWRSVSTPFLRTFVHAFLLGRIWLKLLFALEELAPRFFGAWGQYPLIVFSGREREQS